MKLKIIAPLLACTMLLASCNSNAQCSVPNKNSETTQAVENNNESLYDIYKNKYGYVGSEDEFYYDLGYGQVGTKKTYKINFGKVNGGDHEKIDLNVTFKNGEKIDFSKYVKSSNEIYIKATDNQDIDSYVEDSSEAGIDIHNYRAHKDCTIIFFFEDYDVRPAVAENCMNPATSFYINEPLDLDLQFHFSYKNIKLTLDEIKNVSIILDPRSVPATFDKTNGTILVKEAGILRFRIKYLDVFTSSTYMFNFVKRT